MQKQEEVQLQLALEKAGCLVSQSLFLADVSPLRLHGVLVRVEVVAVVLEQDLVLVDPEALVRALGCCWRHYLEKEGLAAGLQGTRVSWSLASVQISPSLHRNPENKINFRNSASIFVNINFIYFEKFNT